VDVGDTVNIKSTDLQTLRDSYASFEVLAVVYLSVLLFWERHCSVLIFSGRNRNTQEECVGGQKRAVLCSRCLLAEFRLRCLWNASTVDAGW
jgi:hypothetical protein